MILLIFIILLKKSWLLFKTNVKQTFVRLMCIEMPHFILNKVWLITLSFLLRMYLLNAHLIFSVTDHWNTRIFGHLHYLLFLSLPFGWWSLARNVGGTYRRGRWIEHLSWIMYGVGFSSPFSSISLEILLSFSPPLDFYLMSPITPESF